MLREIRHPKQYADEKPRRWINSNDMDLVVWLDNDEIVAFQISYDKSKSEHALSWKNGVGFHHDRVDDGENRPFKYKGTPILVPDGELNLEKVAEKFRENAALIDRDIFEFIYERLLLYPAP